MDMYHYSLEGGELPPTLRVALIALICRPDKDSDLTGSYHPISFLPVESKIFAKALTLRLEELLPTLVHKDQTGFVKSRLSSYNLRHLFHIISEALR